MSPEISVIIVNYNTKALLRGCIDSIRKMSRTVSYEIIVVDNASRDGSVDMLLREYPDILVLPQNANLGFGAANNAGAARASGKYLLFLNSDTVLENDALGLFYEYAEAHSKNFGIAGAYLRRPDGQDANSIGVFPSFSKYIAYRVTSPFSGIMAKPQIDRVERRVDAVTGADMFMRRDFFEALGGFDKRFFMYFEETELALRTARAGRERIITPGHEIVHFEGASAKAKMPTRIMMERSMYKYFDKTRGQSLGFWAFYFIYSLVLGTISALPYKNSDRLAYCRAAIKEFPGIVAGRGAA